MKGGNGSAQDDLKAFGASDEDVQRILGDTQNEDFEIYEENAETLNVFLYLSTQWIWNNNFCMGLNYQSLEFVLKAFKIKNKRETFLEIREMETSALNVFRSKKD